MDTILHLAVRAIALMATAFLLPGISISSLWVAIVLVIVLGALNIFVKPIILLLTLPINLVTLGLFTLVINAFIIMIASSLVPGFYIGGFLSALIFSIVLAIVNIVLETLV